MKLSPTSRQMFKIAIPVVLGYVVVILFDLVDIFWIAKLGTETVAGVAAAGFLLWALYSLMSLTTYGCQTLISQARGAKKNKTAFEVARQSIALSVLLSGVVMLFLWPMADSVLMWMGLSPTSFQAGKSYFLVMILGFPILYVAMLLTHIFLAYEDTKTSSIIMAAGLALNMILDPLLIFGWGPFPEWGVAGAAAATIFSRTVTMGIRFYVLRKKQFLDSLNLKHYFKTNLYKKILGIGLPMTGAHLNWTMVYPLLATLITRFGMVPLAGMTIGHRIESVPYFISIGFLVAVQTMVGHSVGAQKLKRAKVLTYKARKWVTLILVPFALLFILAPESLIGLVTQDPQTIAHGAAYLRIIGYLEIFLGWEMVFEGGFSGLGDTKPYMYISVPLTLGRYPLAYFFVVHLNMGVEAIWWAISLSTCAKALLMNFVFQYSKVLNGTRK